jgi:glycerophosphoryl diester phosphodiesterase
MTTVSNSGNHVILIQPSGASPAHHAFARFIDKGPDGSLNWDRMAEAGVYLDHLSNQLVGVEAGVIAHATGAKPYGNSFGFDANNLAITSLDGSNKTIVEAARDAGKVTALLQSGHIAEIGTAAFVAKTTSITNPGGSQTLPRAQTAAIAEQVIRSGVNFIFGGGELNLLPVGTNGFHGTAAQLDSISTSSLQRPSSNLIQLAQSLGYTVVYTKDQLNSLLQLPSPPTKVLGVFAPVHTFNDRPEEVLNQQNLPLYSTTAPTIAEMLAVTQQLVESHPDFSKGSITVVNEEGIDNFSNNNNASGTLEAVRRADAAIGLAIDFSERHVNTLVITASNTNSGGLQIFDRTLPTVGNIVVNPTTTNRIVPPDGLTGANTASFVAATDEDGDALMFGIAWAGTPDVAGSLVAKAHGMNASKLPATLDSTKIYELMYETLFETELTPRNPDPTPAPPATKQSGNVIFILPDGAGPAHFSAVRNIDQGPDGRLNWDRMTTTGIYQGHTKNSLRGTSNAAAVAHATGVRVFRSSFGLDETNSSITSASGSIGKTILEEAIAAGKATAIIQSGHIAEAGTAAFAAKTTHLAGDTLEAVRKLAEIAEQVIRSGTQVILTGGELYLLPLGTTGVHVTADIDAQNTNPAQRPTINLIELAKSLGYTVVYNKAELDAAVSAATATTKLLGVFAARNTFNDNREEQLGLNSNSPLSLYIDAAPTAAEMLSAALTIMSKNENGFFVVAEEDGTEAFSGNNNAIGAIEAARRADAAIGVAMNYVDSNDSNTLVITAAGSDQGGMQVFQYLPFVRPAGNSTTTPSLADTEPSAPFIRINPTTTNTNQAVLDGANGSTGSVANPWIPFKSVNSQDGPMGNFAIAWAGTPSFAGDTVAKAYGMYADRLPSTTESTDIYKLMYETLFGVNFDVSISIAASTTSLPEGNIGSTPFVFSISRTGDLAGESRVSWAVAGSGANPASAADFAGGGFPSGTAVFAPGQDSLTFAVSVVGDASLETDEGFHIELNSPIGALLSSTTSTGLLQILNDDQPTPTYSFVATPQTVFEGGTMHISITTTNVEAGSLLWWQLSGEGITPSDFSDGVLGGSTVIGSDGRAAFTKTIATDAVVDPDETLEVLFYTDAARSKSVGAVAITLKEPSVGVVTDGNDLITGTAAAELITGVPSGSLERGRGSVDQLTGGAGADIFNLGDAQGIYYNDGTPGLGTQDLAIITDFTADDRIQLSGSSSGYRLISGRNAGIRGVRIDALFTASGNMPEAEAIGFVQGATLATLNLANTNQFLYV